jgi:hypothetical protein
MRMPLHQHVPAVLRTAPGHGERTATARLATRERTANKGDSVRAWTNTPELYEACFSKTLKIVLKVF